MLINNRRSFIIGIKSTSLTKKEIFFIKKFKPWGIILFSRNIKSLAQTKKLTDNIRKIFKDKNYPILIDQEGGRVNRLKNFFSFEPLTSEYFGNLYKKDKKKFYHHYKIFVDKTSCLLKLAGINVNTVPVLDLKIKGSSSIIGDRSFSDSPKLVSLFGDTCIQNFHSNNIATVMKHIPGHGLAKVDSHKTTPVVTETYSKLLKNDFSTFKKKKSFIAMTAHIFYKNIDNIYTATHSKKIITLIRNKIKFKNILMTDDISMKGLKFSVKKNTLKAYESGCNLVLHCNGNYKEMLIVAENSPLLSKFMLKKTSQFYNILS